MRSTRLTALAAAALAAVLGTGLATGAIAAPVGAARTEAGTDLPLRELADRVRLPVGTAVDMQALADDARYRRTVAREFSSVTAENVMKWEAVEPTQGQYTVGQADGLVAFAGAHGQKVRGHTLVWHNQLPAWLTDGDLHHGSSCAGSCASTSRTRSATSRGKIWQWDVVNEAFNDDGTLRDTLWLRALGPGYIADAFRWAHEADPKALLFYNDYNIEGRRTRRATPSTRWCGSCSAQGVPIDGVGLQGHLERQYGCPTACSGNLDRFARLGLATARSPRPTCASTLPVDDAETAAQATDYAAMLEACLQARRCTSFTVWGYTDRYSWVPGVFEGEGAATLMDRQFRPKPAYRAAQRVLLAAP